MAKPFLGRSASKQPTATVPVRLSDGEEFVDPLARMVLALDTLEAVLARLETNSQLTNLYLSHILGEELTEEDLTNED